MDTQTPPSTGQAPEPSQNPAATNQPMQPMVPGPKKRNAAFKIIIAVAGFLLVAGMAAAFVYVKTKKESNVSQNSPAGQSPDQNSQNPTNNSPDYGAPTSTPSNNNVNYKSGETDILKASSCNSRGPVLQSKSGLVEWMDPVLQKGLVVFNDIKDPNTDYLGNSSYLVGRFVSGKYQGSDLLITGVAFGGMGETHTWYYLVRQNNSYVLLQKYSGKLDQNNLKPAVSLSYDNDFDLPDMNVPETLTSQNPSATFYKSKNFFSFQGDNFFCGDHLVKAFTDQIAGDVYTDAKDGGSGNVNYGWNGFYVKRPDNALVVYELDVDFLGQDGIALVTWNNGQKNSRQYSDQSRGGCGASRFLDISDVKQDELTQIGATVSGQAIFGYKDKNAQELKDMYDEMYTPDGQTKITYEKFISDNPIFFWRDPFGDLVRFKNMEYQPMAECGKPVIYLYPQSTHEISVKLSPVGGFSYTEPEYNQGWDVLATPEGQLTNLSDGKNYPYLFWEGTGGFYQTPTKGFVVAKADVHKFLKEKLAQAGLNEKETADFTEFWEPKMQSAPYFFVTFMGNSVMDKLAPLSISPKPDTIIRVLMDYKPLEQPIAVEDQTIRTPKRIGFTVVEWGGVLRK